MNEDRSFFTPVPAAKPEIYDWAKEKTEEPSLKTRKRNSRLGSIVVTLASLAALIGQCSDEYRPNSNPDYTQLERDIESYNAYKGRDRVRVDCVPNIPNADSHVIGRFYRSSRWILIRDILCEGIIEAQQNVNSSDFSGSTSNGRDIFWTGILTIGHELEHSIGIKDDTEANCGAVNTVPRIASWLRVDYMLKGLNIRQMVNEFAAAQEPRYHTHLC